MSSQGMYEFINYPSLSGLVSRAKMAKKHPVVLLLTLCAFDSGMAFFLENFQAFRAIVLNRKHLAAFDMVKDCDILSCISNARGRVRHYNEVWVNNNEMLKRMYHHSVSMIVRQHHSIGYGKYTEMQPIIDVIGMEMDKLRRVVQLCYQFIQRGNRIDFSALSHVLSFRQQPNGDWYPIVVNPETHAEIGDDMAIQNNLENEVHFATRQGERYHNDFRPYTREETVEAERRERMERDARRLVDEIRDAPAPFQNNARLDNILDQMIEEGFQDPPNNEEEMVEQPERMAWDGAGVMLGDVPIVPVVEAAEIEEEEEEEETTEYETATTESPSDTETTVSSGEVLEGATGGEEGEFIAIDGVWRPGGADLTAVMKETDVKRRKVTTFDYQQFALEREAITQQRNGMEEPDLEHTGARRKTKRRPERKNFNEKATRLQHSMDVGVSGMPMLYTDPREVDIASLYNSGIANYGQSVDWSDQLPGNRFSLGSKVVSVKRVDEIDETDDISNDLFE